MRLRLVFPVFLLFYGVFVAAEIYQWRNVGIGGGGFVPGVVFHPAEQGLAYTRTDVGGAYRLDDRIGRWIPLNDERHRYGGINDVTGDLKIFGRVNLATSGRDIVYGDLRDPGLDSGEGKR